MEYYNNYYKQAKFYLNTGEFEINKNIGGMQSMLFLPPEAKKHPVNRLLLICQSRTKTGKQCRYKVQRNKGGFL